MLKVRERYLRYSFTNEQTLVVATTCSQICTYTLKSL